VTYELPASVAPVFGEDFNRSVLDALTAHIAVIDRNGRIIAVNQAWQNFAASNGGGAIWQKGVGADYLAPCRDAAAAGDPSAGEAVAGIEAVLTGTSREFIYEYPCHSPLHQRWFLMKVAPVRAFPGAVIAHEDITARRVAEQALARTHQGLDDQIKSRTAELEAVNTELRGEIAKRAQIEAQLRQAAAAFEGANEAIVIVNAGREIVAVNAALTRISGYAPEEVLGRNPQLFYAPLHSEQFHDVIWETLAHSGEWQGEVWHKRRNGETYAAWQSFSTISDEHGRVATYVCVFADISDIKNAEARLADLAHHDQLTGLANRLLFNARLEQALERAERQGKKVALLFLDLDRFKILNDTLGHGIGDKLLQAVAQRLKGCLRREDTVARLGGDEFTILLENVTDTQDAAHFARKLSQALAPEIEVDGYRLCTSASIGISVYPDDATQAEDLLRAADAAMYSAKEQGRKTYRFYRTELTEQAFERLAMEQGLRRALANGQFRLVFQPQFTAADGVLYGMEALLRWDHPERGVINPERFIGVAEESGLIHEIGEWVLCQSCLQVRKWQDEGLVVPRLAINVSAREVLHDHLGERIARALDHSRLDPSELVIELEITESVLQRSEGTVSVLKALREVGVHIAIDDFGTGYSSLAQLKQLPLDALKIDRSFLRELATDPDSRAIVSAVLAMGRSLQLKVIAEGVETRQQLDFLSQHGCDAVQGHLLSRPLSAESMRVLLVKAR